MQLTRSLALLLVLSGPSGLAFDSEPLKDGEGMRVEVREFVLPAEKALSIVETIDGSDGASARCYQALTEAGVKSTRVYRAALPLGKNEFESRFGDAKPGAARPLQLSFSLHRDERRDRVWTYGYVTPGYRLEKDSYASELSLVSSGVTPGAIKWLSVVPDSLDGKEQRRVRVLFAKFDLAEGVAEKLPAVEGDKVSVGVFATEVALPWADYKRLRDSELSGSGFFAQARKLESAEVTAVFGGETLEGGRVRQRAAWNEDRPVEPNQFQGTLFDCDPCSLGQWNRQGEEADGLGDPPIGAEGVLINWFNWQRVLPEAEPVETRTFRWNEDWKKPGIIEEVSHKVGKIEAASALTCVLTGGQPYLVAVAAVGKDGEADRRAVLLFLRAYERPL